MPFDYEPVGGRVITRRSPQGGWDWFFQDHFYITINQGNEKTRDAAFDAGQAVKRAHMEEMRLVALARKEGILESLQKPYPRDWKAQLMKLRRTHKRLKHLGSLNPKQKKTARNSRRRAVKP